MFPLEASERPEVHLVRWVETLDLVYDQCPDIAPGVYPDDLRG